MFQLTKQGSLDYCDESRYRSKLAKSVIRRADMYILEDRDPDAALAMKNKQFLITLHKTQQSNERIFGSIFK